MGTGGTMSSEERDNIIPINIHEEVKRSFLDYAMSVIAVSYTHLDVYKRQRQY